MSLSAIAELATAAGVVLVAIQLWYSRQGMKTSLEDQLSIEYREIALALPPEAFFDPDAGSDAPDFAEDVRAYLRYIDLTNQQVFMRSQRRITRRTWSQWRDGIQDNLETRPAFTNAWAHLRKHMHRSFDELDRLCEDWDLDPAWWDPAWWRRPMHRFVARLPRERRGRVRETSAE